MKTFFFTVLLLSAAARAGDKTPAQLKACKDDCKEMYTECITQCRKATKGKAASASCPQGCNIVQSTCNEECVTGEETSDEPHTHDE